MHVKGPFAYNGVLGFYIPGFSFTVQLIIDGIFLARAAYNEEKFGKEGKLEDYENNVGENYQAVLKVTALCSCLRGFLFFYFLRLVNVRSLREFLCQLAQKLKGIV